MNIIHHKLNKLHQLIEELGNVAVAFSGGVDSTLLMTVAHHVLANRMIAITAISNLFPTREMNEAREFTAAKGIRHIVCKMDEFGIVGFAENPENRCYLCKKNLFIHFKKIADEQNIKYLTEGSNVDDDNDYRPGMKAVRELGIRSPLREVGLTKDEIRQLLYQMDISVWNKPSFACLASRFPYGESITREKLKAVETAEQVLFDSGFTQVRVRHHGNLARIEINPEEMKKLMHPAVRENIYTKIKQAGFTYITIDLLGYRTGSMNETMK